MPTTILLRATWSWFVTHSGILGQSVDRMMDYEYIPQSEGTFMVLVRLRQRVLRGLLEKEKIFMFLNTLQLLVVLGGGHTSWLLGCIV